MRSTENGGALRWPPLLLGEAARLKMGRVPDVGRSANSAYGLPLASLLSLAMRRDSSAAAADSDACIPPSHEIAPLTVKEQPLQRMN